MAKKSADAGCGRHVAVPNDSAQPLSKPCAAAPCGAHHRRTAMRTEALHYRGWDIVPFALPTPGGAWEATGEIERPGDSIETYHAIAGPFRHADKQEAIARAVQGAMRRIDEIEADPLH
jgi:hypothetical protein